MKISSAPGDISPSPPPASPLRWPGHSAAWIWVLLGVLAPLLLFGALAEDVAEREAFHWDTPTLQWLHAHATPRLDGLMLLASRLGGVTVSLPLVIGVALILWVTRRRGAALFLASAVGGACVIDIVAKLIFARQRPDLWLSIAPETDYGFPSGHAMLSTAVVASLLVTLWNAGIARGFKWGLTLLGVAFVLWVGVSRLYLGVHYPSDVIAGWSASLAWVMGSASLWRSKAGRNTL